MEENLHSKFALEVELCMNDCGRTSAHDETMRVITFNIKWAKFDFNLMETDSVWKACTFI